MSNEKPRMARFTPVSKMNQKQFYDWLIQAVPGQFTVYHRGYLWRDRDPKVRENDGTKEDIESINEMGDFAYLCSKAGHVYLVKKRHGLFDYEYRALRRKAGPKAVGFWTNTTRLIRW